MSLVLEHPQRARAPAPRADTEEAVDVGALFDAHAAFLVRVAERLTGSASLAEDVVQEAFIVACRRREILREGSDLRAWLYRVVRNVVRQHRRTKARRLAFLDRFGAEPRWPEAGGHDPEQIIADREHGRLIRAAITDLPLKQREVFVLYELEELSGREIAELLSVGENTVWSRLRLARKRFESACRRRMAREGGR